MSEVRPDLPINYKESYLPNRAFGIELETNVRVRCPDGWDMIEDCSVAGMEYRLGPVLGGIGQVLVEDGCEEMLSEWNNRGCTDPLINENCGYHLHLNARDLEEERIWEFVKFCQKHEDYFYGLVPESRLEKGFSRPIEHTVHTVESLDWFLYAGRSYAKAHHSHHTRYCWVNSHSYYYRGTVEIRLHSGTMQHEKVLRWAEMFLKLLDYIGKGGYDSLLLEKSIEDALVLTGVRDSTIEFYKNRNIQLHGGPMKLQRLNADEYQIVRHYQYT